VLRVESVDERADDVEVFNFEVEDVHNYHVAAEGFGAVGALVGNKAAFVRGWRGENVEIRGTKSSGRLRGYTEATSDMTGGLDAARSNFEEIAGRVPSVPDGATIDRFVGDQLEAVFRPDSRTGTPVVEIIDHSQEIHEKIHFNP